MIDEYTEATIWLQMYRARLEPPGSTLLVEIGSVHMSLFNLLLQMREKGPKSRDAGRHLEVVRQLREKHGDIPPPLVEVIEPKKPTPASLPAPEMEMEPTIPGQVEALPPPPQEKQKLVLPAPPV